MDATQKTYSKLKTPLDTEISGLHHRRLEPWIKPTPYRIKFLKLLLTGHAADAVAQAVPPAQRPEARPGNACVTLYIYIHTYIHT